MTTDVRPGSTALVCPLCLWYHLSPPTDETVGNFVSYGMLGTYTWEQLVEIAVVGGARVAEDAARDHFARDHGLHTDDAIEAAVDAAYERDRDLANRLGGVDFTRDQWLAEQGRLAFRSSLGDGEGGQP